MEIKFRWLSIHWGFVYWYYAYTSKFSNRNDYFKNVIITKDWDFKEIEEWTQALFTWLLDKNWKEIYVWDILAIDWKYNWIVEFEKWMFIIHRLDCSFCCPHTQELKNNASYWEIIWNVYENTELIQLPKEFKPQTKYYNFNDKQHYSIKADWKIYNHYNI